MAKGSVGPGIGGGQWILEKVPKTFKIGIPEIASDSRLVQNSGKFGNSGRRFTGFDDGWMDEKEAQCGFNRFEVKGLNNPETGVTSFLFRISIFEFRIYFLGVIFSRQSHWQSVPL